ncbi:PilZ domain-containing protein [Geomesophilobacter sediminis]|uniref:PilZ domain-containing protein n=1 Tax=Geomesophilobacter sediminis TaxID=2798584 RepID=A0A8J7J894_9BACT|nr:PilZ domain-containing protein [Geomesophilobacter sediminis]MBJ6725771.1 PilZ domain-containing protein [Geomesophilobacter sediminis]
MRQERREHYRVATRLNAKVQAGGHSHEGVMENLSALGAFVRSVRNLELNEEVILTVESTSIRETAKVVRTTPTGVGLRFDNNLFE